MNDNALRGWSLDDLARLDERARDALRAISSRADITASCSGEASI